jgi:hypothetical protein
MGHEVARNAIVGVKKQDFQWEPIFGVLRQSISFLSPETKS